MTRYLHICCKNCRYKWRVVPPALALACVISMGSCAVGPDFLEPAAPDAADYTSSTTHNIVASAGSSGGRQRFFRNADVPGDWWALFRSPRINALVREAIESHPDITAAEYALRQARELAIAQQGQFWPQIANNNNFTRISIAAPSSSDTAGPTGSGTSILYTLYNVPANVSYTPDVWGGMTRQQESNVAQAEYQRYQMEATFLTLTANVVVAAINDAACAEQIAISREIIRSYQNEVRLLQGRFDSGSIGIAELETQKNLAAQAESSLTQLEKTRAQTRHQLMAYLGRYPNEDKGEAVDLDELRLPGELPLSLPSSLVRQRPDIKAAESKLKSASAQIGVTTANMLPKIKLTPSIGFLGFALENLLNASGFTWGASALNDGQLLDGGSLSYQREAAISSFRESSELYKSTVLKAFQNVADALSALQQDAEELRTRTASENAAAQNLRIARVPFVAGSMAYSSVLAAKRNLLTSRLGLVRARASRFADTVALYQALGGGWWNRVDETPEATPTQRDAISLSPVASALRDSIADPRHVHQ